MGSSEATGRRISETRDASVHAGCARHHSAWHNSANPATAGPWPYLQDSWISPLARVLVLIGIEKKRIVQS